MKTRSTPSHAVRAASALLTLFAVLLTLGGVAAADEARKPTAERSHIDMVVALDTSNSMDGLIDSARQKIWDLVNDMATAKPTPILRVGLISFGNDSYSEPGWTRVDVALTDDLDAVYEKLMALKTSGGTEYVGRALHVARTKMDWRKDRKALKLVFVAGNESADQDMSFGAIKEAGQLIQNDVIVNTIYCGAESDDDARGWRQVALRADGQFANIAADGGAVVINTPFDDQLNALSGRLNTTYVPYGVHGTAKKESQSMRDEEAADLSASAGAARAAAKSSALYRNSHWDLVDALTEGRVKLEDVEEDALPAELRGKTLAQRRAYIDRKAKERVEIQAQIAELSEKRDAYIAAERDKMAAPAESAFDEAVGGALRDQAKRKSIHFAE